MIKIKKFESIISNDDLETRLFISQEGYDSFGYVLGLYENFEKEKVGTIIYRSKSYLKRYGYPIVNELHLGFKPKYQGKGYFEDAIIELLKYDDAPIYISKSRVVNKNVLKAIKKLDKDLLNITELDSGYIIKIKVK